VRLVGGAIRWMGMLKTLKLALPSNRPLCWKEPFRDRCLTCRSLRQGVFGADSETGVVEDWAKLRRAWRVKAEDTETGRQEE
jgi:hypothetical protein